MTEIVKPIDTREWSMDDIEDLKEVLPEPVHFSSLSSSASNSIELDAGKPSSMDSLQERAGRTVAALESWGMPVDHYRPKGGHDGGAATLILEVFFTEDHHVVHRETVERRKYRLDVVSNGLVSRDDETLEYVEEEYFCSCGEEFENASEVYEHLESV